MFRLYGWSSGGKKKKRAREIICLSGAEVNVARWTKWSLHALFRQIRGNHFNFDIKKHI